MNFAPLTITVEVLESDIVRRAIGDRIFSDQANTPEDDNDGVLGFIRGLLGGLGRFLGFLARAAWAWICRRFSAVEVLQTLQEAAYQIFYFDWNQSDASLREQIKANNNAMAQLIGRFAGSSSIRLVSVGVAAGVAIKFPVVAGRIALELAEDASGVIRSEFIALLDGLRQLSIENGILKLVEGMRQRRWFGQQPRPEDGPYHSFATTIENAVNAIPMEWLRNFALGFLEGAEDAFWDVGYIIAYTLDDFVLSNKFSQNDPLGPPKVVRIDLDTRSNEEIVLAGPQQIVQQNMELAITQHQLIHNRDVGQIVGIPAESFPRAKHQARQLIIVFKSVQRPPFREPNGRWAKEVSYTVSDAKRGLSWQEIKTAARSFTWGPWRVTANLDNNRQMAVYGASPSEAETQLRSLLTLSTANIVTLSATEEKIQNPAHIKHPTLVYPAYANLVSTPTDFQGQPIGGSAEYRRERRRIVLWTDTEPDDLGPLG